MPRKSNWKPTLGRWKQRLDRRKTFVRRALKKSRASMNEIARRGNTNQNVVSAWNSAMGIRTPSQTDEIAREQTTKTLAGKRKRINHFTKVEKEKILQENRGGIIKKARKWWISKSIRQDANSFQEFLEGMENYIFEQLDFYDPTKKTIRGKNPGNPLEIGIWVQKGADFFGFTVYNRQKKRATSDFHSRQISEDANSRLAIAQDRGNRRQTRFEIAQIPTVVKFFMKRGLGLNIEKVAIAGVKNTVERLIEISRDRSTNLTEAEMEVVFQRLSGRSQKAIGENTRNRHSGKKGITPQAISLIEQSAIRKMRHAIQITTEGTNT